jgi:GIY-YIG catalytic domain
MSVPADDDPITLAEACELFPHAKLTKSTLRAEAKRGRLKIFRLSSSPQASDLTTVTAMREMMRLCRVDPAGEPPNNPTCLYRHFDSSGQLVYVGIASDPFRRLSQHEKWSRWYDQIDTIKIERHPNRKAAEAAELEAIRTEKPLHNIVGRAA